MAKFGINDILNAKTKAAGQQAQTEGYKEIYLSPYEVKAAQENTHQRLENIEELADSFLHVGQEQPTVLARVNGEYRIIFQHINNICINRAPCVLTVLKFQHFKAVALFESSVILPQLKALFPAYYVLVIRCRYL